MDREIAPVVRRRATVRRIAAPVIAFAAVVFLGAATIEWLRPSIRRRDVQTAVVAPGNVDGTVQAAGIVMPEDEQAISSPVEARILRVHRRAGDTVRKGDELLTLDISSTRLEVERLDEQLAQKQNEETRLKLQIEENLAALRAQLQQRKLDREILDLKAEQTAALRAEGLVSDHDARLDATAARKTAIEVAQLEQKVVRAISSGTAQLAAHARDVSMLRKERDEARRQLDLAMMRAGRDGVITAIAQEEGTTVRRGDVLARIADLSSFRIVATVSDLYVPRLSAGMPVRVRVDDTTTVSGTLDAIDPRIENGVAKLHIALDPAAHGRLRNNLRVDAFIVTSRKPDVLQVRRGSLGRVSSEHVFVVRDKRLIRVPVRWGGVGEDNLEILGGLAAGDEIVISDMSDYEELKEMRLR